MQMHEMNQPPHAMMEHPEEYSLVFNLLGIPEQDIGVNVSETKRELTVLARKRNARVKQAFFWNFGIPSDALMRAVTARYQAGVLEVLIPRTGGDHHA